MSPTLDGEAYYRRCTVLLADVEEAEGAFAERQAKGTVASRRAGHAGEAFSCCPRSPDFFARYPDIELFMSESDRWIDVVREGVDCVVRWGTPARQRHDRAGRSPWMERLTCASPAYLEQHGVPTDCDSLEGASDGRHPLDDNGAPAAT